MNSEKQSRSHRFARRNQERSIHQQGSLWTLKLILVALLAWNATILPCSAQGQPGFLAPGDGSSPGLIVSSSVGRFVTFNWGAASGAASYQLNLRDVTTDPNGPVSNYTLNAATTISILLASRHAYKWNVYACSGANATGTKTLSTNAWFRFLNPPYLESPGNPDLTPPVPKVLSLTPWISWDTVPESDGYWFYLSKAPYGQANIIYDYGFGTSIYQFQLPPGIIEPGGSYRWNMTSLWGSDESPTLGRVLYFTVDTLPTAPNSLTASGGTSTIGLAWNHSSPNADGQKLERKDGDSGVWNQIRDLDGDAGAYTDSNVTPGVVYYYRIHAYNGIGDSAISYSGGASLIPSTYTLSLSAVNGIVMKSPDLAAYAPGTSVTLTPFPNSHYSFSGWGGDASGAGMPLTLTMTGNRNITATFVPTPVPIALGTSIGGTINGSSPLSIQVPSLDLSYTCIFQLSRDNINWFSFDAVAGSTAPISWQVPTLPNSDMVLARVQICVSQYEPPFLIFPIKGITDPYAAIITAIYDHDMGKIGSMRTYRNEQVTDQFTVTSSQSTSLKGFKKDASGTPFDLRFNYDDGSGQKKILWYDEHSGYDYKCDLGTEIIAAADGSIDRTESLSQSQWNGLCIYHNNGYRTYYLHLSRWSDVITQQFPLAGPILVHQGDTIGYAGNYGVRGATGTTDFVHLHLSVKNPSMQRVDPYGEFVPQRVAPIQSVLWVVQP
jgi:hypothetical protein